MTRQLRLGLERNGPPPSAEFTLGPSNNAAAKAVEAWPTWSGGCLALIGPEGSGKSHLALGWAGRVGAVILDADAPDIASAQGRPALLEDADRHPCGEALFHLINMAAQAGGSLLLTARTLPARWASPLPDLRSRLNALPVAEIGLPDDTVLRGALAKLFRDRNIRPAEDIYDYLLARMGRSIPQAREIVRRLDEAGDFGFRPVTRVLAREVLEENQGLDL